MLCPSVSQILHNITKHMVKFCWAVEEKSKIDTEYIFTKWLTTIIDLGLDIQAYDVRDVFNKRNETAPAIFDAVRTRQLRICQQFEDLKHGCSLKELQDAIESGDLNVSTCDIGGGFLTHISAAYDRSDVLQWLVENKNQSLNTLDAPGANSVASSRV